MHSKELRRIILVVFFALIILIAFVEFSINMRRIKQGNIRNQEKAAGVSETPALEGNDRQTYYVSNIDISKKITDDGKSENKRNYWRVIERKDSYNNELQFYSKDNIAVKDNIIIITSKEETKEDKEYTSGQLESTSAYKYGYFEFTIMISEGKGLFPAIWLLPQDGYIFPEIDIFEVIGNDAYNFYGVIHYMEKGIKTSDYFVHEVPKKDQYSVALLWSEGSLTWYIDNQEIYTTSKGVPQDYMYIIINQAIGGDWPGAPDDTTVFPSQFIIRSTRIEPVYVKGRY